MTTATCIEEIGPARCTGCFGCESACPSSAIQVALDPDGFYKPVVDAGSCNDCGTCKERCPVILEEQRSLAGADPIAFAAWTTDEQLRLASSSGGVFSELATDVLRVGGAVAGCVWGPGWTPEHVLTSDPAVVERMRGSKYVPSRVGDVYDRVRDHLQRSPTPVLFSGTPCQVAAMHAALSPAERRRTLLMDFICHGVPSLRVFHRYLDELFDGEPVAAYTFRDKRQGWKGVRAESVSGRRHEVPMDAFGRGFELEHLYVMEACHSCIFARMRRVSDITVGDFWGCPEDWYDRRGVSVALAHTDAGLAALHSSRFTGRIKLAPADIATALEKNPRATGWAYAPSRHRRAFLDGTVSGESFVALARKYFPGKWAVRWRSFVESGSKTQLLTNALRTRALGVFRARR